MVAVQTPKAVRGSAKVMDGHGGKKVEIATHLETSRTVRAESMEERREQRPGGGPPCVGGREGCEVRWR